MVLHELTYSDALAEQARRTREHGRAGWLLFTCPPTITFGRRGKSSELLASPSSLAARGVQLLEVSRGGLFTYHGPGQVVGFPTGSLESHSGDPRGVKDFVCALQARLKRFLALEFSRQGRPVPELACEDAVGAGGGVWMIDPTIDGGERRKLVSIGLKFTRDAASVSAIEHGFALNVFAPVTGVHGFDFIVPCGRMDNRPGYVFNRELTVLEMRQFTERLGRFFEENT